MSNSMNNIMSPAAVASRYKGVQVSTASPVKIVAMLFDGAIRFTNEADEAFAKGDRLRAGDRINRAHAIVEELAASLDPTHAPELADNLLAVYGFCMRRLIEANLHRDRGMLGEVVKALNPLREAWTILAGGQP